MRTLFPHTGERLKNSIILCLIALLIFLGIRLAFSSPPPTVTVIQDGAWWLSLTPEQRIIAVEAALEAYESGYLDGRANGYESAIRAFSKLTPKEKTQQENLALSLPTPRNSVVFSQVIGYYSDIITTFYRANPDLERTRVGDVLSFLSDDENESPAAIAKTIRGFHRNFSQ